MKILGLDSSGLVASVAVVEDDRLLAEYTTDYKKTHSQTLLPMLDELKKMIELDCSTLDAIAISSGPGSFTGLRIGSATAKGLGLALKKPLVEVPTLGRAGMESVGSIRNCMSRHGCPEKSGVHGGLYLYPLRGGFHTGNGIAPEPDGCGRSCGKAEWAWKRSDFSGRWGSGLSGAD